MRFRTFLLPLDQNGGSLTDPDENINHAGFLKVTICAHGGTVVCWGSVLNDLSPICVNYFISLIYHIPLLSEVFPTNSDEPGIRVSRATLMQTRKNA